MREILFRGKCTDTGRWYEGQYIHLHKTTFCFKEDYESHPDNDIHQIVFERMTDWGLPNEHRRADVIPETVGQFTGLTDRNGKKIFEGDIVRHHNSNPYATPTIIEKGKVYWDEKSCGWRRTSNGAFYHGIIDTYRMSPECVYEVIGNIYDNPKLLKGE